MPMWPDIILRDIRDNGHILERLSAFNWLDDIAAKADKPKRFPFPSFSFVNKIKKMKETGK